MQRLVIPLRQIDSLENDQEMALIPCPYKTQFSAPGADSIPTEMQQLSVHPPAHTASPQSSICTETRNV